MAHQIQREVRRKEVNLISIAGITFAAYLCLCAMLPKPETEAKQIQLQTFEITAYTNSMADTGKSPTDKDYGITASGSRVKTGDCACPPEIPFGTKVYIPELGRTLICTDRGGDIKGKRLDVYMPSRSAVKQFGRQRMQVEIKR